MSARVRVMLYGMKSSVLPAHSMTGWLRRDGSRSWITEPGSCTGVGRCGGTPAEPQQRGVARGRRCRLRHVDHVTLQLAGEVRGAALPAGPAEGQTGPFLLTSPSLREPVLLREGEGAGALRV